MFNLKTNLSIAKGALTKESPFYIQFFISNQCFLKCRMCNIVAANRELKRVDLEQIEKIACNLSKIGAGVVLLTGGEPFLRNDIVDIVRIFRQYGLTPRLQTAGLLSRFDSMLECCELGARDINVSLDTLDEELGDWINGSKGSWRRAIQTIGRITREFPAHDTVCAFGCVLSPYNIDHVEDVLDFADAIGWSLSLVPVHVNRTAREFHFRGYDKSFVFSPEDRKKIRALIARIHQRKKNGDNIFDSEKYLDSIVSFAETGHPSWRHNGVCDSPNLYFAIRPDGRFAPCCDQDLEKPVYVYDENFPKIYKSRKFREQVRKVTAGCPGCNYGSYPEMTLTVRHFPTFVERVKLELSGGRLKHKAYSDEELFALIEKIRKKRGHASSKPRI
ncbi:MAG: radical SAM protein [Ruminococcus sp.]|nr:radical SAM protein [Ruminococcus sp.]